MPKMFDQFRDSFGDSSTEQLSIEELRNFDRLVKDAGDRYDDHRTNGNSRLVGSFWRIVRYETPRMVGAAAFNSLGLFAALVRFQIPTTIVVATCVLTLFLVDAVLVLRDSSFRPLVPARQAMAGAFAMGAPVVGVLCILVAFGNWTGLRVNSILLIVLDVGILLAWAFGLAIIHNVVWSDILDFALDLPPDEDECACIIYFFSNIGFWLFLGWLGSMPLIAMFFGFVFTGLHLRTVRERFYPPIFKKLLTGYWLCCLPCLVLATILLLGGNISISVFATMIVFPAWLFGVLCPSTAHLQSAEQKSISKAFRIANLFQCIALLVVVAYSLLLFAHFKLNIFPNYGTFILLVGPIFLLPLLGAASLTIVGIFVGPPRLLVDRLAFIKLTGERLFVIFLNSFRRYRFAFQVS